MCPCQENLILAKRGNITFQPCFGFCSRIAPGVAGALFYFSNQALENTGGYHTLDRFGITAEI